MYPLKSRGQPALLRMSRLEINAAVTISGSIPPWVTTELLLANHLLASGIRRRPNLPKRCTRGGPFQQLNRACTADQPSRSNTRSSSSNPIASWSSRRPVPIKDK